ncbi:10985_t:CDS:2 [Gigaspora rosea]|nr:10985_t:CDS:2 [Gigaspora rosea]
MPVVNFNCFPSRLLAGSAQFVLLSAAYQLLLETFEIFGLKNTFTKQEGKKEIREVLEEEPLDEKVNKKLIEMEKEPL